MASKKKKTKTPAQAQNTTNGLVDIEAVNLRTAGPVTRLRGVMAVITAKLQFVQGKLVNWSETNETAKDIADSVETLKGEIEDLVDRLESLEASGFSPARKSFTAQTTVGDHVSILEKYRDRYEDLVPCKDMDDLVVIKRRDGRGGGLVLEVNGVKLPAASAHVVRLSSPKAA
jgi:hypothetical protein